MYAPCATGYTGCVSLAGGGCVLSLFGYPACVAVAIAACAYAAAQCRKSIRYSATCCPVRCGGSDVFNVFGEDPKCCPADQTCIDPRANDRGCCAPGFVSCAGMTCCAAGESCEVGPDGPACCAAGTRLCGGTCCPNGSCQNGQCCNSPSVPCGAACCPPLSSCCGGRCCDGICLGTTCCRAPARPCGNACCPTTCCNNVCCAAGQACNPQTGACASVCLNGPIVFEYPCEAVPGNPPCCEVGRECCPGVGCCARGQVCCCDSAACRCVRGTGPGDCLR